MPAYLDPFHGVSESVALTQAAVSASIEAVMLYAYELWHPSRSEPIRVVADHADLVATLEDDAPRNAGEEVTFLATDIRIQRPSESDGAKRPEVQLSIDNVNWLISDMLRAARGADDPAVRDARWEVIERVYMSTDVSAPHRVPVFKQTLRRVTTGGATAVFVASYRDSANHSVPAVTFTPEAYPGLS